MKCSIKLHSSAFLPKGLLCHTWWKQQEVHRSGQLIERKHVKRSTDHRWKLNIQHMVQQQPSGFYALAPTHTFNHLIFACPFELYICWYEPTCFSAIWCEYTDSLILSCVSTSVIVWRNQGSKHLIQDSTPFLCVLLLQYSVINQKEKRR